MARTPVAGGMVGEARARSAPDTPVRWRHGLGPDVAMDETRANWWMDDASRWHEGVPPPGWWKAEDGRWHRPDDRGGRLPPDDDEPTVEMQTDEF